MIIEIDKLTAHSRAIVVTYEDEQFTFKATDGRDRFPEELINDLQELIDKMHDHNELMYIRDEERK